jgi:hypothetical protein
MNNCRQDLRVDPVFGPKLAGFREEWNAEEHRSVDDMIHWESA